MLVSFTIATLFSLVIFVHDVLIHRKSHIFTSRQSPRVVFSGRTAGPSGRFHSFASGQSLRIVFIGRRLSLRVVFHFACNRLCLRVVFFRLRSVVRLRAPSLAPGTQLNPGHPAWPRAPSLAPGTQFTSGH